MRTYRSFVILASVIGMLAFAAVGLWAAAAEESGGDAAMATEMITDPTSGAQFTTPTYGGALTLAAHAATRSPSTRSRTGAPTAPSTGWWRSWP